MCKQFYYTHTHTQKKFYLESPLFNLSHTFLNDERHLGSAGFFVHQAAQLHAEYGGGRQLAEAGRRCLPLLQQSQLHIQQAPRLQLHTQLLSPGGWREGKGGGGLR